MTSSKQLKYVRHLNQNITQVYNEEYGTHYIARQDISPGTLIDYCVPTYITQTTYNNSNDINSCIHECALHILQNSTPYKYLSAHNTIHSDVAVSLPTDLQKYTTEQWQTAINIVQTNSISITTDTNEQQHICIYNKLCLYNHSCAPNVCIYYTNNNTAYVYAIQPIQQSQQLYISYRTDLLHLPTQQRQSILYNTWGFHCTCTLCTTTSMTMQLIESDKQGRLLTQHTEYIANMDKYVTELIEQSNLTVPPSTWLNDIETLLLQNNTLHNAHWLLHKLRWNVMPVLLGSITDELDSINDNTNNNDNKTTNSKTIYIKQWRNKLLKILTQHIDSTVLIEPALHCHKLQLYNTYTHIACNLCQLPKSIVLMQLQKLDPSYVRVCEIYTGDEAVQQQNDMVISNQYILD